MNALSISGLSAGYHGDLVLKGIDLTINRGEWVGLLGRNGAGKSTLLRTVLAVHPVVGGQVRVDGLDAAQTPEDVRRRIGYAIPPQSLPRGITLNQFFALNAKLQGYVIDAGELAYWRDLLGLGPWMATLMDACSLGTQQKASILAAVLQPRPLLIFDESLNGLDPVVSIELKRALEERVRRGDCAIVLATHMVDVVRNVCSRMIVLNDGVVRADIQGKAFEQLRVDQLAFDECVLAHMS